MTYDVSVIIPGYNTPESQWRRCLDSVRSATKGCSVEIICVDDGSEDGAAFLDQIDGIAVIHHQNVGPSLARNIGMSHAHGEWISFADSDDEVLDRSIAQAVACGRKEGCDVVFVGVETVWTDDGLKKQDVLPEKKYGQLTPGMIKEIADANLLHYIWNKVYRRSFLDRAGVCFPDDAVMGEDLIFNFRCIESNAEWMCLNLIGYRYFRGRSTLLSRYKPQHVSGLRHTASLWRRYKSMTADARTVLGDFEEPSECQIERMEWENIWMPGTPYGLIARWKWLREHPDIGGFGAFLSRWLYVFLRRHFYVRPVRRWHIRRMYPYAEDL